MPFTAPAQRLYVAYFIAVMALTPMLGGCAAATTDKPSYKAAPKEAVNPHE